MSISDSTLDIEEAIDWMNNTAKMKLRPSVSEESHISLHGESAWLYRKKGIVTNTAYGERLHSYVVVKRKGESLNLSGRIVRY